MFNRKRSDACAKGSVVKTGAEWAAPVTATYPGYSGFRLKMYVFHGTADTALYLQNLRGEIKRWTAVLGLIVTASSTTSNAPVSGWARYRYGLLLKRTRHRVSRIVPRPKRAR